MPSLRSTLDALAQSFASDVLTAIRAASLGDLQADIGHSRNSRPAGGGRRRARRATATATAATAAPRKSKGGRLARRSPEDIARSLASIVTLVKKSKTGLRSEQIRAALKLDRRELPRVLAEGLRKKALKSKGQKRATTYFAA